MDTKSHGIHNGTSSSTGFTFPALISKILKLLLYALGWNGSIKNRTWRFTIIGPSALLRCITSFINPIQTRSTNHNRYRNCISVGKSRGRTLFVGQSPETRIKQFVEDCITSKVRYQLKAILTVHILRLSAHKNEKFQPTVPLTAHNPYPYLRTQISLVWAPTVSVLIGFDFSFADRIIEELLNQYSRLWRPFG